MQESAPNKKGRWVVSLFSEGAKRSSPPNKKIKKCNLDEAMIRFTSYNAAAQPRWVGKAGSGGDRGVPGGAGCTAMSIKLRELIRSIRACKTAAEVWVFFWGGEGEQAWRVGVGTSCNLAAVDFLGEAPGSLWVAWHQCLDGMDSLQWTDGGLKDLSIWDNLSGLNAFECFFARLHDFDSFFGMQLVEWFQGYTLPFVLLFGSRACFPLSSCGWHMFLLKLAGSWKRAIYTP